jgi:hypothetical protein
MKTLAGLWIDHREAIIVLVSGKREETRRHYSPVDAARPIAEGAHGEHVLSKNPGISL